MHRRKTKKKTQRVPKTRTRAGAAYAMDATHLRPSISMCIYLCICICTLVSVACLVYISVLRAASEKKVLLGKINNKATENQ